jgi:hypothetical protein
VRESRVEGVVGHVIGFEGAGYAFTHIIVYAFPHAVFVILIF